MNEEEVELDKARKEVFHHIMAKLLFVAKCVKPDIDLTILFLCSRVDKSTEKDWGKLQRLLHYIIGTMDDERIILMGGKLELRSWKDASYGVHHDMQGHSGGVMSMGRCMIHHKTGKQKLNTKSWMEYNKIFGASDFYLPHTIWMRRFLMEQGYKVKRSTLFQGNESAIKMVNK